MILQCSHISKSFDGNTILNDISFHINEQEKTAIVGVNGSGKSTLLKILMGEYEADDGEIIIQKDAVIGYLAQNQDIDSAKSVLEEMQYAKKDAQEELERLLSETDYSVWCQHRLYDPRNYRRNIRKYVNAQSKGRKKTISDGLKASITELCSLAYTEKESNARLLSEVFQPKKDDKESAPDFQSVNSMTEKHLSDLLNVPLHKERFFQTRQAELELENMGEESECPVWILKLSQEYGRGMNRNATVGEAKEWIASYRKENKRRCLQIQRQDILPLILYVAQHRYLEEIGQDMSSYRQKDALELFRTLADSTLAACNMSRLNEAYELDAVLCACYQAEEMFGYAELLELKLTK